MISPLLPLLLSSAYFGGDERVPSRLINQNFGSALQPDKLILSRYGYYLPSSGDRGVLDFYNRPWASLLRPEIGDENGVSSVNIDKDTFKVILDVQQFKPEEIEVKVVDKYIVISAKHEEKLDEQGLISRQFVRRYAIPENLDVDRIASTISTDGVLTVQAPLKQVNEDNNVRKIKIEQTGKPAKDKEAPKEAPKEAVKEAAKEAAKDDDEGVTITTEEASTVGTTAPGK